MVKKSSKSNKVTEGLAPTNVARKLSSRDIALGIGRAAKEEELEEYLNRNHGKIVTLSEGIRLVKSKLKAK